MLGKGVGFPMPFFDKENHMTINELLTEIDEIKPNAYDDSIKIRWVSVLEGKIVNDIILTHKLSEVVDFNGYTINDMDTELLVPDTYADVYKYYVFAMIDSSNGENNHYANDMMLFNTAWNEFANYYNRTNEPNGQQIKVF